MEELKKLLNDLKRISSAVKLIEQKIRVEEKLVEKAISHLNDSTKRAGSQEVKLKPQIWLDEGGRSVCVIDDCFGTNPIVLIHELREQDRRDGTVGGRYYVKSVPIR